MKIIVLSILLLYGIAMIYCIYQLIRNEVVCRILMKWIKDSDDRFYKYDYNDDMFYPSKSNWYGLKFPLDKDFK